MLRPRRSSNARPAIEPLEPRIAPAVVFNARTLIFNDFDGDLAIVKFSKDVFTGDYSTQLATANAVFKFDAGSVAPGEATSQQLRLIDLTKFPTNPLTGSIANGLSLSITTQQRAGDGTTDVGAIKATGISLGTVTIDGDLGQIDAGSIFSRVGLAGLSVNSLGGRGTATQIPVPTPTTENPAPDLVSTITGELTALKVSGDVTEARLSVVHGRDSQNNLTTLGNLRSISIGGSLTGRAELAVASENTGFIEADGNIGAVKIGTAVADGIHGGGGKSSGRIRAGGSIASVIISGGIDGGAGAESGTISASSVGPVKLGGTLAGGAGESSGGIRSLGNLGAVKIAGNIAAGTGAGSGVIFSRGAIGAMLVSGNIDGSTAAAGAGSAGIFGQAGIASVTVLGNVTGGAQAQTGFIESGRDLGSVQILGDLAGGAGDGSGAVIAHGKLAAIKVSGDLLGGAGRQSGFIRSGFDPLQIGVLGSVAIAGFMLGGGGDDSGAIVSSGAIRSVAVGSADTKLLDVVRGGAGAFSGAISGVGKIGTVKIMGAVHGGGGDFSGSLIAFERTDAAEEITGDLGAITISGALAGGSGAQSGAIFADGKLAALTVGAIEGGAGAGSASIQTGRGLLSAGDSGAIKILGSLAQVAAGIPGAGSATIDIGGNLAALAVGGAATGAAIHAGDAIGSLSFGGDVTNVTVTARGQAVQGTKSDVAITKIAVRGGVTGSSFLAGYDAAGVAVNPDAQVGTVTVGGNWTASNLVAGIAGGADPGFGNALDVAAPGFDNAAIVSRIASVIIGGTVTGSAAPADLDHFGFVAQMISKFKASGIAAALKDATAGQFLEFDEANDDVTLREITT